MLMSLMTAGLVAGLALIALPAWWAARRRKRWLQLEQEYLEAYRVLHVKVGPRLEPARFTYRPRTHELQLDARAARLHGWSGAELAPGRFVTVDGWQDLPASAGVAGWLDDALADGLASRQPVECEYLSRMAGRADRYFILNAVPLQTADVLVGAVAQTRPSRSGVPSPDTATATATATAADRDMGRAWLPGPRARTRPSGPP